MGTYTQRKWFDLAQMAEEQEKMFHHPDFRVPGIAVDTRLAMEGTGAWLYLTHTGELVNDDSLLLPNWERVA